jgi:hypothetical protein
MILALVCSTANRLNSSTVAPPLRLSSETIIPRKVVITIRVKTRLIERKNDSCSQSFRVRIRVRLRARIRIRFME